MHPVCFDRIIWWEIYNHMCLEFISGFAGNMTIFLDPRESHSQNCDGCVTGSTQSVLISWIYNTLKRFARYTITTVNHQWHCVIRNLNPITVGGILWIPGWQKLCHKISRESSRQVPRLTWEAASGLVKLTIDRHTESYASFSFLWKIVRCMCFLVVN